MPANSVKKNDYSLFVISEFQVLTAAAGFLTIAAGAGEIAAAEATFGLSFSAGVHTIGAGSALTEAGLLGMGYGMKTIIESFEKERSPCATDQYMYDKNYTPIDSLNMNVSFAG